jgi:hypothetical protein
MSGELGSATMELAKQQQCCVRSPRWRPGEEVVTVTLGKLLVGAALLSVVTALVPSALAVERPDDRAGPLGVGGTQVESTLFDSVGTADTVEARILKGLDGRGAVIVPIRPDDQSGPRGVGSIEPVVVVPVAASADRTDPLAVGAAAAVIALLGVAIVYAVEHGRRTGGTGTHGTPGAPAHTR